MKNEGKAPVSVDLRLEYVKAYTKSPGQNSVSFEAPQAPVGGEAREDDLAVSDYNSPVSPVTGRP